MGQYYRACVKQENGGKWHSLLSGDFYSSSKLTEHSWIGNWYVFEIEKLLFSKKRRVVWAGDYADNEKGKDENLYESTTPLVSVVKNFENNLNAIKYQSDLWDFEHKAPIIYNHTKNEYIDLADYYSMIINPKNDFVIHPLPILTCEGNGRGNGDYYGVSAKEYVGVWARNVLSMMSRSTFEKLKLEKNPTKIEPHFAE